MISHQTALIYAMVIASAADGDMSDAELREIGELVRTLPVFKDYDSKRLTRDAADCASLLAKDEGLGKVLDIIADSLPQRLRETAYALACDVVAADLHADDEELRLLQMMRFRLEVDRLTAAAIERGTRARHATL